MRSSVTLALKLFLIQICREKTKKKKNCPSHHWFPNHTSIALELYQYLIFDGLLSTYYYKKQTSLTAFPTVLHKLGMAARIFKVPTFLQ